MKMSALSVYLLGVIVLVGGIAFAAHLAGLSPKWIVAGAIVLLGAGIIAAVGRTRQKDPPAAA